MAMDAVTVLVRENITGFWIHLDADVLNDEVMPAVDYRQPGGLSYSELSDVLRILLSTRHEVGLTVTIFNPSLDPDGGFAHRLVESIVEGLMNDKKPKWISEGREVQGKGFEPPNH